MHRLRPIERAPQRRDAITRKPRLALSDSNTADANAPTDQEPLGGDCRSRLRELTEEGDEGDEGDEGKDAEANADSKEDDA